MKKKIAKLGIIAVLTFALILSSLGALPFGDTLAKEFDVGAKNQTTAQAEEAPWTYPASAPIASFVGSGTDVYPFEISTAQQLADLSYFVNNANTTYNGIDVFYKLTANIVLNAVTPSASTPGAKPWTPIGNVVASVDLKGDPTVNSFLGSFDGNDKTVSGIYINNTSETTGMCIGLFGNVGSGTVKTATVKNLGVINSYIKGNNRVGGVAGVNYGSIINCYNSGAVNGVDYVGGVVGDNYGSIISCYNTDLVNGTNGITGGVVGQNEKGGSIINCYNTGTVNGVEDVGGVAGRTSATLLNCYNTGAVTATTSNVGGIAGYSDGNGTVANCYNRGAVDGATNKGGVVGLNLQEDTTVANCYFLLTDGLNAVGQNEPTSRVTNCSAFNSSKKLTVEGKTDQNVEGALIKFSVNADLLATLNTGATTYNENNTGKIQMLPWFNRNNPSFTPEWTYPTSSTDLTNPFAGGKGTVDAPYLISDAQELANMSYLINTKNEKYSVAGVHYKLTADIGLNNTSNWQSWDQYTAPKKTWMPIGNAPAIPFNGSFNGDGHTVSGIYISDSGNDFKGLFGATSATATIKNVGVINSYINGKVAVGGVVGLNYGVIINCYNSGTVTSSLGKVGGVAGINDGAGAAVINCYNSGNVNQTGDEVGGVVGLNYGAVANCYFLKITSGINSTLSAVGKSTGTVANCSSFDEYQQLTTPATTEAGTNKALVKFDANADLTVTLNAGATEYNKTDAGKAIPAAEWLVSDTYPTFARSVNIDLTPNAPVTYDKTAKAYEITGADSNLTGFNIAYRAHTDEVGAAYSNTAPTEVGSYDVKITRDQDAKFVAFKAEIANGLVIQQQPPTPPAGGGDSDSEPSISPEDIFWTGIVTDLKHKDEPVVEFNCKYPRMSRSVLLALQEVDKTLNINLNGEKISLTSKQAKSLTFDKASYSVAELKALLEKPVITPTPTPTPTEKPTEPVVPEKPAANLTWLWISLAVIVVAGAVAAFVVIKRKKK